MDQCRPLTTGPTSAASGTTTGDQRLSSARRAWSPKADRPKARTNQSLMHRRAPPLGLLGPLTPVREVGSGETVRPMTTPPADAGPDIVALLLDGDDPSVRYFTLTLFGEPAEGVAAAKARHRIMTDGAVASSWRHGARRVIGANVTASTRQAHRHGLADHHPGRTQRVWRRRASARCSRRHPCSQPRRATQ